MARSPSDAPKPQRRPVGHVEVAIELLATGWKDPVAGSSDVVEAFVVAVALSLVGRRMSVEQDSLLGCIRIHSVRVRSDAERLGHRVGP